MAARREIEVGSSTTTTEPAEFVSIMDRLEEISPGRLHPRMRPWYLRRYYENPAGFELTADEAWEGRNPLGLLHCKLRAGLHLTAEPTWLHRISRLGENDPEPEMEPSEDEPLGADGKGAIPAPVEPCPDCGTGAGEHVVDCPRSPNPGEEAEAQQ